MRKITVLLCLSLLLLTGCTGKAELTFLEFRETVANAEAIGFTADIRAEYSDKTVSFTVDCRKDAEGMTVEVTEPELIKGIRAHTDGESLRLEYDGAILDLGKLHDCGMSPMSALPLFVSALRDAHMELTWEEDGMTAARLVPEDDMAITLWISENGEPVSAEITVEAQTLVFIEITNWEVT